MSEDKHKELKLKYDSDLAFHSFVEAFNLINEHKTKILDTGLVFPESVYTLKINYSNYHTAYKIAVAANCEIEIDETYGSDEWSLNIWLLANNCIYTAIVRTEGA